MLRAAFVIDYQNVHMTAADLLSIADSRTSITTGNSTGDASIRPLNGEPMGPWSSFET